jgi:hypothetical protein
MNTTTASIIHFINNAIETGPSAESQEVVGFTEVGLRKLLEIISDDHKKNKTDKFQGNLLVHVLLDAAYYNEGEEAARALAVLDEICPEAAKDIREDNYALKYVMKAA